jgi:tRNA pseudouridine38-40 synthase
MMTGMQQNGEQMIHAENFALKVLNWHKMTRHKRHYSQRFPNSKQQTPNAKTYLCNKIINLPRYFVHLAYDGTAYHGWQSQDNARSVQTEVEKCLSLKLSAPIKLTGCGRTDTGVHARNYYAHFDLEKAVQPEEKPELLNALNHFLPADIVLFDLFEVKPDANARFDAISRTYRYYINTQKLPFGRQYAWYVYGHLDLHLMQQCADYLLEVEDFTSFSKLHSAAKTNICRLTHAHWQQTNHGLVFSITADRFLRNMVRAIVGTLIEAGRCRHTFKQFKDIVEARDRGRAGLSAPANGLFLEEVVYPVEVFARG